MAMTLTCSTPRNASLADFIEHLQQEHIDPRDVDSIASAAPMLSALSNDRELIVRPLNQYLKLGFKGSMPGLEQSIPLAEHGFFRLRANVWPSTADITAGRVLPDQFAYDHAHDHNFHFMTIAYFGAGYVTEIYEYDYERVEGYIGEMVDLRFLERTQFSAGRAMLYRANRDLHIQFPPEDLSITLSLMAELPELRGRDQFFFDLQHRTISGFAPHSETSRRIDVIAMAGQAGDDDTCQVLGDLAASHPCRRTRLAAYEALVRLRPEDSVAIWERASGDSAPLVANEARARLAVWRP